MVARYPSPRRTNGTVYAWVMSDSTPCSVSGIPWLVVVVMARTPCTLHRAGACKTPAADVLRPTDIMGRTTQNFLAQNFERNHHPSSIESQCLPWPTTRVPRRPTMAPTAPTAFPRPELQNKQALPSLNTRQILARHRSRQSQRQTL